jgi:hypothetical protein
MKIEPTQEQLRYLFEYNTDGYLVWKALTPNNKTKLIGKIAGTDNGAGYIQVSINKVRHVLHRLIWIYHNGNIQKGLEIDHRDVNNRNNKIDNLRVCTRSQGTSNRRKQSNQTSRYKGVSWSKEAKKWRAQITINYRFIHLGMFNTEEEAYTSYCKAAKEYHGEFACLV